jgi:hypothetical protein
VGGDRPSIAGVKPDCRMAAFISSWLIGVPLTWDE